MLSLSVPEEGKVHVHHLINIISAICASCVCECVCKKKDIHKQTWQHPESHKRHCNDYVIMRRNRRKCLDVSVM